MRNPFIYDLHGEGGWAQHHFSRGGVFPRFFTLCRFKHYTYGNKIVVGFPRNTKQQTLLLVLLWNNGFVHFTVTFLAYFLVHASKTMSITTLFYYETMVLCILPLRSWHIFLSTPRRRWVLPRFLGSILLQHCRWSRPSVNTLLLSTLRYNTGLFNVLPHRLGRFRAYPRLEDEDDCYPLFIITTRLLLILHHECYCICCHWSHPYSYTAVGFVETLDFAKPACFFIPLTQRFSSVPGVPGIFSCPRPEDKKKCYVSPRCVDSIGTAIL